MNPRAKPPNKKASSRSKKRGRRPAKKRVHILWTPEEVEMLKKSLEKKLAIRDIADLLGKSEKSIRKKCEWLGISSATTYRKGDQK